MKQVLLLSSLYRWIRSQHSTQCPPCFGTSHYSPQDSVYCFRESPTAHPHPTPQPAWVLSAYLLCTRLSHSILWHNVLSHVDYLSVLISPLTELLEGICLHIPSRDGTQEVLDNA